MSAREARPHAVRVRLFPLDYHCPPPKVCPCRPSTGPGPVEYITQTFSANQTHMPNLLSFLRAKKKQAFERLIDRQLSRDRRFKSQLHARLIDEEFKGDPDFDLDKVRECFADRRGEPANDGELIARICRAYKKAKADQKNSARVSGEQRMEPDLPCLHAADHDRAAE
jgi:hypothetical protein